jgi:HD-GYP domain-containing protein (c-di-GMP phosphodiesterase class II)
MRTDGENQLVEVPIDQIKPGWVVDKDIFLGTTKLVAAGVRISPGVLFSLRQRNIEKVTISIESELAGCDPPEPNGKVEGPLKESASLIYANHQIIPALTQELVDAATAQLTLFYNVAARDDKLEIEEFRPLVSRIVNSYVSNRRGAAKMLVLEELDQYTLWHSVNTSLLYAMVAQDWFSNQAELEEAVLTAMLHDVGKARVGQEILNKPGPLTDEEWVVVRNHPIWSHEILESSGVAQALLPIPRSHHERLDGTGYPDGLKGLEISRHARLAAVCDIYDALTTPRAYKQKMDFASAVDLLFQSSGDYLDAEIVHHFILKLGRYPVGTFVNLSSGEVAVVVRTNPSAISRPVVSRVVTNDGEMLTEPEEMDLRQRRDIQIVGVVDTSP